MRNVGLLVVASLAGTLLGCGQKGPLVQPDAQHPHKKIGIFKSHPPTPPPAPASPTPVPNAAPADATATGEPKTAPSPSPAPQP